MNSFGNGRTRQVDIRRGPNLGRLLEESPLKPHIVSASTVFTDQVALIVGQGYGMRFPLPTSGALGTWFGEESTSHPSRSISPTILRLSNNDRPEEGKERKDKRKKEKEGADFRALFERSSLANPSYPHGPRLKPLGLRKK